MAREGLVTDDRGEPSQSPAIIQFPRSRREARALDGLVFTGGSDGRLLIEFSKAAPAILDADLLLYRRRGMISIGGRGVHCHAAKASWVGKGLDVLMCLETRSIVGARAVTLRSQVDRYPGQIDVYETNPDGRWPEYDRRGADRRMWCVAGKKYGYVGLVLAALLHLPIVRWFVRADIDDQSFDRRPPFCSHACAYADRVGGGVDPVPYLADRLTEPADLARSPFYHYLFTLVPDENGTGNAT